MFLLNYSQDILFVVLAFAVLWLTAFVTWLLYYLVMSAKEIYNAANKVKRQVEEVENMVSAVKQRLASIGSYALLAGQIAKKLFDYFKSATDAEAPTATKTQAKKNKKRRPVDDFLQTEL